MHVFTGDVSNAGTNSNVFICVYGELGDTGERKLEKSETHLDKFERNNVRIAQTSEDIFMNLVFCVISVWTNRN